MLAEDPQRNLPVGIFQRTIESVASLFDVE